MTNHYSANRKSPSFDFQQEVSAQTAIANDSTLSQARDWGFICNLDLQGKWQILPQQSAEAWKLQLVGDRWLLLVSDVPQVLCHPSEAVVFLECRRPAGKTSRQSQLCN